MSTLDLQYEIRKLQEEVASLKRQVQELENSKFHTYGPMKITDWPSPQKQYVPFPDIWCGISSEDVERVKKTLTSEPSEKAKKFYDKLLNVSRDDCGKCFTSHCECKT